MDVFSVRDRLVTDYRTFTGSFVAIHDRRVRAHVEQRARGSYQWQVGAVDESLHQVGGILGRLTRPEVEHVLDSFFVVRKYEERDHGEFRTRRLVLERYDATADATRVGHPHQTVLDPPPGHGPRHAPNT